MELKEFVKNTITSISEAVIEAQSELEKDGVVLNPPRMFLRHDIDGYDPEGSDARIRRVQEVKFDVAVTASEGSGTEVGGGIGISVLKAGADVSTTNTSERANRVAFTIPIAFPPSTTEIQAQQQLADARARDKAELEELMSRPREE